jgi:hypothetical protein
MVVFRYDRPALSCIMSYRLAGLSFDSHAVGDGPRSVWGCLINRSAGRSLDSHAEGDGPRSVWGCLIDRSAGRSFDSHAVGDGPRSVWGCLINWTMRMFTLPSAPLCLGGTEI